MITISKDLKKKLQNIGVKQKIEIVNVGLDIEKFEKVPNQEKIYDGIFVGRHSAGKGVMDLIFVWNRVVKKIPNAKLILVGSCSDTVRKQLEKFIRKYNMQKNIILKGVASETEKIKLLKQSKMVVFLSRLEGWGLTPIEGFACGVPCVVYDLPVYEENIKQCKACFFIPIGNFGEVSKSVIELLKSDTEYTKKLGEMAESFVKRYDWDKIAKKEFNFVID